MGSRVWFMSRATGCLTYGVNEKREREPKRTGNKPPLGMIWFVLIVGVWATGLGVFSLG